MDKNSESKKAVRNLGGAGADAPPPSGIRTLADSKGPLCSILGYPVLAD